METLGREVKQQEQKKTNVRKFISVVKKYTDMTQLDATILRKFVGLMNSCKAQAEETPAEPAPMPASMSFRVSHRKSTLAIADRAYIVESGRLG